MQSHKTLVPVLAVAALAAACGGSPAAPSQHTALSAAVTSAGPLTLSMAPAGPLVQGTFTAYTVTLTNTAGAPITAVDLSADFPDTTVNQIPAGCVRTHGLPEFFCTVASIAPGETVAFDTQVRPDLAGTLTFQSVSSGNGAPFNFLDDVEEVSPAPTDVQVTGASNNGSPPLGSLFTYTFQVKNNGPYTTFGGVSFTDALPSSLTYAAVATSLGTCSGGAVVSCVLGDLAVGAQATVQISVQAPPTVQTIVDTASAAIGQQADRNPANNSVSVTVTTK